MRKDKYQFIYIRSGLQPVPLQYFGIESALFVFICMIVCVYTAWVNEASIEPAAFLNTVASSNYDREVQSRAVKLYVYCNFFDAGPSPAETDCFQ